MVDRAFAPNVTGVERGGRLEQQNVCLFIGHGTMFGFPRNDDEFTFLEPHMTIAEFHAESTFNHEEKLIFLVMVVPEEFALEFNELDKLTIELSDDPGTPGIFEDGNLFAEIYLIH
jgi:hypothetical protein